MRRMQDDLRDGVEKESSITFGEWMETWLSVYKSQTMSAKSLKNLASMLRSSVTPRLGTIPLRSIKPVTLQRFLNELAETRSQSYVQKIKNSIEGIFATAVDNRYINHSPAERITMPSVKSGHRRALTELEREFFIKACSRCGMAGLWGLVLFYTGMRPAETANIQGKDIGTVDGQMVIHVKGTKTKTADRYVPVPPQLPLPAIKENELLLHTRDGRPMTEASRRRAWSRIIRQMNIEMGCQVSSRGMVLPPYRVADDLVPYCLRHNYATMLQEGGADIGVIAHVLGHSSTATTSRVYTHLNMQSLLRAGEVAGEYFP